MPNNKTEKHKRLTEMLYDIHNGDGWVSISKDDDDIWLKDLFYLEGKGLITKFNKYDYRLSPTGEDIVDKGWTYSDWSDKIKESQPPAPTLHIGHNITGSIQESDLRITDLNFSTHPPASNETKTSSKVGKLKSIGIWLIDNIWKIIIGVIIAIVIVYAKKYFGLAQS